MCGWEKFCKDGKGCTSLGENEFGLAWLGQLVNKEGYGKMDIQVIVSLLIVAASIPYEGLISY